jgi:hypothetical protein
MADLRLKTGMYKLSASDWTFQAGQGMVWLMKALDAVADSYEDA